MQSADPAEQDGQDFQLLGFQSPQTGQVIHRADSLALICGQPGNVAAIITPTDDCCGR